MFWENFMESLSYLITYRGLWLALYAVSLTCLYQIFVRFVPIKQTWYWKACLIVSLYLSISVIIWVGDENLLYAFPAFMLSTMRYAAETVALEGRRACRIVSGESYSACR